MIGDSCICVFLFGGTREVQIGVGRDPGVAEMCGVAWRGMT